MALLTQWTWVWVSSESWWWTGKPGVLQSMGSQRVGPDWATETELSWVQTLPFHARGQAALEANYDPLHPFIPCHSCSTGNHVLWWRPPHVQCCWMNNAPWALLLVSPWHFLDAQTCTRPPEGAWRWTTHALTHSLVPFIPSSTGGCPLTLPAVSSMKGSSGKCKWTRDRSRQAPGLTASLWPAQIRSTSNRLFFSPRKQKRPTPLIVMEMQTFPAWEQWLMLPQVENSIPTAHCWESQGSPRESLGHQTSSDLLPPLDLVQWEHGSPHPKPGYPGLAGSQLVGSIMALRFPPPWPGDTRDMCSVRSESCWELSGQAIPSHVPATQEG